MASEKPRARRRGILIASLLMPALALSGCAGTSGGSESSEENEGSVLTIGTTDKVTSLDPAGSYDQGSYVLKNQVYASLMNSPYGSSEVAPDLAETAEFTAPNEYTVTLKKDLKFANGNPLTASDVKFSFERMVNIDHSNGPATLLYNLDSVATDGDQVVIFKLKSDNDQVFPQILGSPAGYVVDEDSFSATELTSDNDIVKAKAFAGQYVIESYDLNNLVSFKPNPDYQGLLGAAANAGINVKYYADSSNLKLEVQEGAIDAAYRSLSATDIADLSKNDKVKVHQGPGGEIRYIGFNFNSQPFGASMPDADPAKALAVRQAVADLIDREEIASEVYKGTYTPLFAYIPEGLPGATSVLKELYGDGNGKPSVEKAKKRFADAAITGPVALDLQYSNDHYGPSSGDEYALIKAQLESSGLFKVNLQTTEWVQYTKDRVDDVFPAYQLGWFPDYSDGDNYVTGLFLNGGYLQNHYEDDNLNALILKQAATADPGERVKVMEEIHDVLGAALPTVTYLQGAEVVVAGAEVAGVNLDASFKFRYATMTK